MCDSAGDLSVTCGYYFVRPRWGRSEGRSGHGMPFFSLSLKIFATLGITQVNLISALAYSKKSLHWDLRCFSGGIVFIDVLGILDACAI